ncbi:MAG: cysteine desulfurase family protein [Sphaerochaetaceae bacterium]
MSTTYFDWAATTPMSSEAIKTYNDTVKHYSANPSAIYESGKKVATFLGSLREQVAEALKITSQQLIFTSGATESNALVLSSLLWKQRKGNVIFSSLEHPSVSQWAQLLTHSGFEVRTIAAKDGYVNPQRLKAMLDDQTQLVSILLVSNLLGTVQPLGQIAQVIRAFEKQSGKKIILHTDAVQALGKLPFDLNELDVDCASFSAHKFQGPRGVGLLYHKGTFIKPLSSSGGQEQGLRGGTENSGGIAASATALLSSLTDLEKNIQQVTLLRQRLEKHLAQEPSLTLFSPSIEAGKPIVPHILSLGVNGIPSEVSTRVLNDAGFAVSSGSACSAHQAAQRQKPLISTGLKAQQASTAIRISFGHLTTEAQIDALAHTLLHHTATIQASLGRR